MKYPYIVVKNGVWYSSGENVPEDSKTNSTGNDIKYKKSDINRMPIAELRELGNDLDILESFTLNGPDLKKKIIEKLGL